MTPSLKARPTKAKETPYPYKVILAQLDTNPVLECVSGDVFQKMYC